MKTVVPRVGALPRARMLVRPVQLENAESPMVVMLAGRAMLVRPVMA